MKKEEIMMRKLINIIHKLFGHDKAKGLYFPDKLGDKEFADYYWGLPFTKR